MSNCEIEPKPIHHFKQAIHLNSTQIARQWKLIKVSAETLSWPQIRQQWKHICD